MHTQWSSDPFHDIIIRHELLLVWIKKIAYLIITFNDDYSVFSCFSVDNILSNNNICHYYCSLVLTLTLKTKTAEKPKLNWLLLEFEMGRSQMSTVHDSKNLLQMIKFIRKQSWSYIKLEERMLGIVKHICEPLYKWTKWISAYLLENEHMSPCTYVHCAYKKLLTHSSQVI